MRALSRNGGWLEGMIYGNVHRIWADVPDLIRLEEYYRFRDDGG